MDGYFSYIYFPNRSSMKPLLLAIILLASRGSVAQPIAHLGLIPAEISATEKVYNIYVSEYRGIIAHSYSLTFDDTRMTYQGIRNSIIPSLSNASFANPEPGVITSLWFEGSLSGEDYIDSTVLYQMVFNVIEPGGSNLCFSQTPLAFEFVDAESNSLDEIIIHDDCFDSLLVVINPSSIAIPISAAKPNIENPHMTTDGQLSFTVLADQTLAFNLYDIQGHSVAQLKDLYYVKGRNLTDFGRQILPGAYLLECKGEKTSTQRMMILVQ